MTKLDYNKKLIGKKAIMSSGWSGIIEDVIDEETFLIRGKNGDAQRVDIYEIIKTD